MEKSNVIVNYGGNGLTFEDDSRLLHWANGTGKDRMLIQDLQDEGENDPKWNLIQVFTPYNGSFSINKDDADDLILLLSKAKETGYIIND